MVKAKIVKKESGKILEHHHLRIPANSLEMLFNIIIVSSSDGRRGSSSSWTPRKVRAKELAEYYLPAGIPWNPLESPGIPSFSF